MATYAATRNDLALAIVPRNMDNQGRDRYEADEK